eukprot:Awhi_evm1s10078
MITIEELTFKDFRWLITPPEKEWTITDKDDDLSSGPTLTFEPDHKRDFWRKTYYQPEHVADDGHFFGTTVSEDVTFEVSFKMFHHLGKFEQFDQKRIFYK